MLDADRLLIQRAIQTVEAVSAEMAIILVINTKGHAEETPNFGRFSIMEEYFSDKELEEIIKGLKSFVGYIDICYGEKEFIYKLNSGHFNKIDKKYKVVYSSTGSGIYKCKSAIVPGLCDFYSLPYCSNDAYTSALLENKVHTYNLLTYHSLPIAPYWVYEGNGKWQHDKVPTNDSLLIAKPSYQCSSIGIQEESVSIFCTIFEEYIDNVYNTFNQPIIVQKFIKGYEVEVPLFNLDGISAPLAMGIAMNGKGELGESFLSYDIICEGAYQYYDYEKQNPVLAQQLKDIAKTSYAVLDLKGVVRVDFRIDSENRFFITDYNNTPHLTENHSCARSFTHNGYTYADMLKCLLYGGYRMHLERCPDL